MGHLTEQRHKHQQHISDLLLLTVYMRGLDLGIMASQRPPSGIGRPLSRSGSVVPGPGRPPTAIRPPPTAIRVATGVSQLQL